jgi:hypothetical protein
MELWPTLRGGSSVEMEALKRSVRRFSSFLLRTSRRMYVCMYMGRYIRRIVLHCWYETEYWPG